jgi:hypothetical protein
MTIQETLNAIRSLGVHVERVAGYFVITLRDGTTYSTDDKEEAFMVAEGSLRN